eukprot:519312-Rhodomonas_salina.2
MDRKDTPKQSEIEQNRSSENERFGSTKDADRRHGCQFYSNGWLFKRRDERVSQLLRQVLARKQANREFGLGAFAGSRKT